MPDTNNLRHLIKLLEDDSSIVRESVLKELSSYGPDLDRELARQQIVPAASEIKLLNELLTGHSREQLKRSWETWRQLKNDKEKLEQALTLLAEFQYGTEAAVRLHTLLDSLAEEFSSTHKQRDAKELSRFLFREKQISGADQPDYYNPLNSNLLYVIQKRKGLPISLACVYILVGHRLGLPIEGCNFPGHFLATAYLGNKKVVVDCYHGGIFLDEETLADLDMPIPVTLKDIIQLECNAETIVSRVLRNLIKSYEQAGDPENRQLMIELLEMEDSSSTGTDADTEE